MIDAQKAPFSGELFSGITKGVGTNNNNISTVKITDIDIAMNYLSRRGLSTRKSTFTIDGAKEEIKKIDNGDHWMQSALDEENIQVQRQILEQRVSQWERLSQQDRVLVEEGFPVLYGIAPKANREVDITFLGTLPKGDHAGAGVEVSLTGGSDFSEIVSIFVPNDKVELVQQILSDKSINHIRVSPIEPIEEVMKGKKSVFE